MGTPPLLLRRATLADGSVVDVHIADGRIVAVGPAKPSTLVVSGRRATTHDQSSGVPFDGTVVDLDDHLLVPSFVEPHAHLDKAFLAETVPNPSGDLIGAIEAMQAQRGRFTHADTVARATRAVELMLANGVTAIRTHADTTHDQGLMSVEALAEVREHFRGVVEIQVVAMACWVTTPGIAAASKATARDAMSAGADVVGGCPHLEDDPVAATDWFIDLAATHGVPLDLHTDETLDPSALHLEQLARRVIATGFDQRVTASHCVSLGVQSAARQREIAALVAEAGIDVVALPHTNLFLQGRDQQAAMPRGLTAVRSLRAAGVTVAAGADNLQDPFNPLGRGDPLETAGLMVMTAHLLPDEALFTVSDASRHVLGLPPVAVRAGAPADLVAVAARTTREAIAFGPAGRIVISRGRLVRP